MCSSLCFMVFMCIWWLHPCQKRLTRKDLAKVPQTQTVPTVSTFSEWAKRNLLQAVSKWSKTPNKYFTVHYFTRINQITVPFAILYQTHMQSSLRSLTKYDHMLCMPTSWKLRVPLKRHEETQKHKYIDTKKTRSIQPRFKARFLQAAWSATASCNKESAPCSWNI